MTSDRGVASLIVAVGIASAFHVGKLPPAIPVLAQDLGVTLVQGGFLLAVIQLAGMLGGGRGWHAGRPAWAASRSPTAHREAETAKAHRG